LPHSNEKENCMALIEVTVIESVFTTQQKEEIVERLTDAMVAIEGENMRQTIWCIVQEVSSGHWGVGGGTLTADDVRALARATPRRSEPR
jgi:4-oxalocrotonate tautomerase